MCRVNRVYRLLRAWTNTEMYVRMVSIVCWLNCGICHLVDKFTSNIGSMCNPSDLNHQSSLALPFPEFMSYLIYLHFTITEKSLKTGIGFLVTMKDGGKQIGFRGQRRKCSWKCSGMPDRGAHGVGYHERNIFSDIRKLSILALTKGLGS